MIRRGGGARVRVSRSPVAAGDTLITIFWVGDPHCHSENSDPAPPDGSPTNPLDRQAAALIALPGTPHPLGRGLIAVPDLVGVVGDLTHEDFGTTARYESFFAPDGSGVVPYPSAEIDGDHDRQQTRDLIVARHGSLTWGKKIGPIYIQALTENYPGPFLSTPPTAAQIQAVDALLALRPAGEPTILLVHRALGSVGYEGQWASDALDALEALCHARNIIAIVHGHDHYSYFRTWRGIRIISPGSVRQAPEVPPYSTTYPESFVIMRIGLNWWDAASYLFGYNVYRQWVPATWEWMGSTLYLPFGPTVQE